MIEKLYTLTKLPAHLKYEHGATAGYNNVIHLLFVISSRGQDAVVDLAESIAYLRHTNHHDIVYYDGVQCPWRVNVSVDPTCTKRLSRTRTIYTVL